MFIQGFQGLKVLCAVQNHNTKCLIKPSQNTDFAGKSLVLLSKPCVGVMLPDALSRSCV